MRVFFFYLSRDSRVAVKNVNERFGRRDFSRGNFKCAKESRSPRIGLALSAQESACCYQLVHYCTPLDKYADVQQGGGNGGWNGSREEGVRFCYGFRSRRSPFPAIKGASLRAYINDGFALVSSFHNAGGPLSRPS